LHTLSYLFTFFSHRLGHHPDLHSFPTRRSSDLAEDAVSKPDPIKSAGPIAVVGLSGRFPGAANVAELWQNLVHGVCSITEIPTRSEEHTSELQSLTNLVCRLLLEKKKYKRTLTL